MISGLVVETNWILDVILERDTDSAELLRRAAERQITAFLPSFSVAEAVKVLEGMQAEWKRSANQLLQIQRDLDRSSLLKDPGAPIQQAIDVLAEVHDLLEENFWPRLKRIVEAVTIVEPTAEIIDLTATIRDVLKLSPADSSVLATVVSLSRAGGCRVFVSRDKEAFGSQAAIDYMDSEGVQYFDGLGPILGPWRANR